MASAQDIIVDNRSANVSQTGTWEVSGGTSPYGSDSVWARGADDTFTWHFTPTRTGNYEVYEWHSAWSTRTSAAPHRITYSGGARNVSVNQKVNGGQWNSLGVFPFVADAAYGVTVTSVNDTSSTCADAVRFVYRDSSNSPPVAVIDSITPTQAQEGTVISFIGHGTDSDGVVVRYLWTSNIQGELGTTASLSRTLSAGTHTISFLVYDDDDAPSLAATRSVTVLGAVSSEVIIDNGDSRTSFTGVWEVSGAVNPFDPTKPGATSVWSRDGATYTWTFTPSTAGTYQVSMWWTQYTSRSTSIPVSIEHSGGTAIVSVNQRINGGKWNVLGSYPFSAGVSYRVRITAQPGPSSTCADAVRFVSASTGNQAPVAAINSIDPRVVTPGSVVSFSGSGSDADGTVTAFEWTSDINGLLSQQAAFSSASLSPGTHTISFRVRDNLGAWSKKAVALLVVRDCETPVAVMPLGDSITYGVGETADASLITGYREPLFQSLKGGGYYVDFVGDRTTGQRVVPPFDIEHQGVPGIADDSVADFVYNWLVANPAEIVLLHIGTNAFNTDPVDVENILREIDRYEVDHGTQITVVLARIINRKTPTLDTTIFNDNIQDMAEARIAAGDKIVIVDQEHALTYPTDMWDSLHPNNAGYSKMAGVWAGAVTGLLPACSDFKPFIFSTPVTSAAVGQPDTYNVGALGKPTPTYALVTHPAGMTISAATGKISWMPAADQVGAHAVRVRASHQLGTLVRVDEQSFTINVTGAGTEIIIDNGDAGTSFTGSWLVSGAPNPYDPADPGKTSLFSRDGTLYRWTFTPSISGTYEVSMWWTEYSSRSTSIPISIEHSAGRTTVAVNQRVNGGKWNVLGSFSFVAGASYNVTITSQPGPSSTCADAVRFVRSSSTP
jgi:lysophospholipase L1-like esterase